jgi:hypothetical protein
MDHAVMIKDAFCVVEVMSRVVSGHWGKVMCCSSEAQWHAPPGSRAKGSELAKDLELRVLTHIPLN